MRAVHLPNQFLAIDEIYKCQPNVLICFGFHSGRLFVCLIGYLSNRTLLSTGMASLDVWLNVYSRIDYLTAVSFYIYFGFLLFRLLGYDLAQCHKFHPLSVKNN